MAAATASFACLAASSIAACEGMGFCGFAAAPLVAELSTVETGGVNDFLFTVSGTAGVTRLFLGPVGAALRGAWGSTVGFRVEVVAAFEATSSSGACVGIGKGPCISFGGAVVDSGALLLPGSSEVKPVGGAAAGVGGAGACCDCGGGCGALLRSPGGPIGA